LVLSAGLSLISTVILDAFFWSKDSKSCFNFVHRFSEMLLLMASETVMIDTAFNNGVGSLVIVVLKAELPTSFSVTAFLFTVVNGRDALRVINTSLPFSGAFFLKTFVRGHNSNSSFNLIEAVVVKDAFPESLSRSVTFFSKAVSPASLVIIAFFLASLKSSNAALIFSTSLSFSRAVVSDTLFGTHDGNDIREFNRFSKAVFFGSTLGEVGCR